MKLYRIYNALTWIALFLSITAFTRLLQVLYTVNNFPKNEIKVSIFRNNRKLKESCKIKKNSLLDLSSKPDEKNLIIIIDAYPIDNVYKEITGKDYDTRTKKQIYNDLKKDGTGVAVWPYLFLKDYSIKLTSNKNFPV